MNTKIFSIRERQKVTDSAETRMGGDNQTVSRDASKNECVSGVEFLLRLTIRKWCKARCEQKSSMKCAEELGASF